MKKWSRFRHRIYMRLARIVLLPIFKIKYNFKRERIKDKRNYLVIFNHQSVNDQFFIALCLYNNAYFVMSDDFDAIPFVSPILRHVVHPIPYKKASTDLKAIKSMIQVAREGKSVVIAPEGNRTYRGVTEYINPSITKLAKALKLPLAIFNIHAFYANPRFSKKSRKANVSVNLKKVIEYDDFKDLEDDVFLNIIKENLYVNVYDEEVFVKSNHRANYLERVLYQCPDCGITHFKSSNNEVECLSCHRKYLFNNKYQFESAPFKNLLEWDNYQREEILKKSLKDLDENFLITSDITSFSKVIPHKKKETIYEEANISLYKDRIVINDLVIPFVDIKSTGCFGANKVNLILDDVTYQIKGDLRFNPLKYVYHIYKFKIESGQIENNYLGI